MEKISPSLNPYFAFIKLYPFEYMDYSINIEWKCVNSF